MAGFEDAWSKKPGVTASDNISEAVRQPGPLKPRLTEGARMLAKQKAKLDAILEKERYRDRKMLAEVASAKRVGNMSQANALAAELVQMRKTSSTILMLRTLIEKTENRFLMYDGIGDVAVTIEPILGMMRGLKASLGKFMPEADREISQMVDVLGGYMESTTNQIELNAASGTVTEDVEGVLEEAAAVLSDSMGERLPSTPSELAAREQSGTI